MQRVSTVLFLVLACAALRHAGGEAAPPAAPARPVVSDQVVFQETGGLVAVEAEHFFRQTHAERRAWYLTTAREAPRVEPDGDPPHAVGASGGAYLEALPDTRRTHADPLVRGENFSDEPGKIGVLSYRVHFQTPGRYYVWARIYSTTTEDNGLHVGIDGQWPESGRRMQWTAKNQWFWDSKQRTAEVHTGVPHQLYLDVDQPGVHTIQFSMREDGFEFDRWLMTTRRDFPRPGDAGPPSRLREGRLPDAADASPRAAAPRRPNLVVFLSDDHGQLDSSVYGAGDVRTPAMRRLADAGMTFTHAFVASPACAPSRAALLTGLMPARNGAEANHSYKRDDVPSLPETLRRLGYQTAAFGKVGHGRTDIQRHGFEVTDPRHDAAFLRAFLEERDASRPLCLFVGTHEPHVPWPDREGYDPARVKLPPTFVDTPETRDFRARYYTDVTKADTLLGQVMELARRHLDPARTLLIYSSDHGAQWPFGKWNLYDAGIRVPLIAAWPGVIRPGSRADAMVQWTDLLPTLIDAAGGAPPAGIDGLSFLPVLRGQRSAHREEIFATHSGDGRMNVYPIRAVRTRDWKLVWNLRPEYAHTTHIDKALARDGGRYWVSWYEKAKSDPAAAALVKRYHQRPKLELYDLAADPHEQRSLAAEPAHAGRVKELRARLEAWMAAQGDRRTVFNEPRLLSDPASTRPGEMAGADP